MAPLRRNISHYVQERSRGRIFSAILHFVALLFVIFGLPSFLQPTPPEEPVAISVEILPLVPVSNVKPSEKLPEEEQPKKEAKPVEQKKASPPVKVAENSPPPPPKDAVPLPEEKKPEEKKKPEPPKPDTPPQPPKPEEKKKAEEKKKPKKEDPLQAILKAVKDTAAKEEKKPEEKKEKSTAQAQTPDDKRAISSHFDPNMMMGLSEKDAIRSQISKCWNPPIGAKDAQNLVILVNVEYAQDGRYMRAEISDKSKAQYNSDPFFRAAADSAVRAVQRCSPLTGLPPEKYEAWHYMEINFDPRDMLN